MGINKFRLKYTELIGDEIERDGEMIIETKDIKWTLEQFGRNRHIIKMDEIRYGVKMVIGVRKCLIVILKPNYWYMMRC